MNKINWLLAYGKAISEGAARLHEENIYIWLYHNDHLSTPQELVGEDGEIVWQARYKAWGRIHALDVNRVAQPLRFQGQYEDEETGLCYNRYRYYDPDSARFLT